MKNEVQNLLIQEDVKVAVAKGRVSLILSDRVTHLEILIDALKGWLKM